MRMRVRVGKMNVVHPSREGGREGWIAMESEGCIENAAGGLWLISGRDVWW